MKLIYQGSRDTFAIDKFAEKCGDKGPLLLLVKSESGRVFGGIIVNFYLLSEVFALK